jgi:hypothetical protein
MRFEKGHQKQGGRVAGTPNKVTKVLREQIEAIVQTMLADVPNSLPDMPTADRMKVLTAMLPYVLPKLSSTDVEVNVEEPPAKPLPDWLIFLTNDELADAQPEPQVITTSPLK